MLKRTGNVNGEHKRNSSSGSEEHAIVSHVPCLKVAGIAEDLDHG